MWRWKGGSIWLKAVGLLDGAGGMLLAACRWRAPGPPAECPSPESGLAEYCPHHNRISDVITSRHQVPSAASQSQDPLTTLRQMPLKLHCWKVCEEQAVVAQEVKQQLDPSYPSKVLQVSTASLKGLQSRPGPHHEADQSQGGNAAWPSFKPTGKHGAGVPLALKAHSHSAHQIYMEHQACRHE